MPRKSLLRPTLVLVSFLSLLAFYSFVLHTPPNNRSATSIDAALGNRNALSLHRADKRRGGEPVADDALLKYPGNQHSAEWYLFSDMNRPSEERIDSAVTRVMDPEEADLFYVPFFSSLSLVANPVRSAAVNATSDKTAYSDEQTQEALMDWLEEQNYWKRNNGWDHVFICQDPNALYKVIDRVKNGVLLVSDFGRLARNQASLEGRDSAVFT
ncbi:hypothetical protein SASPL_113963 [Salvia splendens]|uniref:Exostosin GT47 domain-containing protein n=1 Tax=Salvia splendens TaxID=180675 RepID=A0A8X8Y0G2_SALSN|nr:hypothetical protein SASPL_113963 [Salvia splendens]